MKTEMKLSEAEQLVIERYRKTKTLAEEFLAQNHPGNADEQFAAVVRGFNEIIASLRAVHGFERIALPKKERCSRYVNWNGDAFGWRMEGAGMGIMAMAVGQANREV